MTYVVEGEVICVATSKKKVLSVKLELRPIGRDETFGHCWLAAGRECSNATSEQSSGQGVEKHCREWLGCCRRRVCSIPSMAKQHPTRRNTAFHIQHSHALLMRIAVRYNPAWSSAENLQCREMP